MTTLKTIFECPAYRVLERRDYMTDGETIAVPFTSISHGMQYHMFKLGSVAGSAIESGDCPVEEIERSKGRGHELWYAFPTAVCLTSHKREQETHYIAEEGNVIRFHGRHFEIVKTGNQNIGLEEIIS